MPKHFRIATFNCENLFQRTKLLNQRDEKKSATLMDKVSTLQRIVDKPRYTDADKRSIASLSIELKGYIDFRKDKGSFGAWKKDTGFVVHKSCSGRGDWFGNMVFKSEDFSDAQRANTARVIAETKADALCVIEVEGMEALQRLNSDALNRRYRQFVSIDSPNDPRGIDVGCMSIPPIYALKTHIFDRFETYARIFSRDCLEVALDLGGGKRLHMLCNHFKSQRGDPEESAAKRKAQARYVAEILKGYALDREYVAVLGDLNEDSSNPFKSLAPLFEVPGLSPVVDPGKPVTERYTHFYESGSKGKRLSQLDYIFVSKALHDRLAGHGFVREGIYGVAEEAAACKAAPVQTYDSVGDWSLSASDHAALWADFAL